MKPSNVYGSIHVLVGNNNISLTLLLNWDDSPQNQNETDVRFYDISLLRNHSDGTNNFKSIRVSASRQTLSYKYTVSNSGNYTRASITAVDLCGQRSEASEFQLMVVTDSSVTNAESNDRYQQTIDILAGVLALAIAIIIVLCIVFISAIIIINLNRSRLDAKKMALLDTIAQPPVLPT
jgi:hypothetical protein